MNSNVQLEELADGALAEKFQQVLAKAVDNLRDVNTSYKTKRKITIQLDFIQDESREDVRCDVAKSEESTAADEQSDSKVVNINKAI